MKKVANKKSDNQIFRFCCRCVNTFLIKNGKCCNCKGKFLVYGYKDNYLFHKSFEKIH